MGCRSICSTAPRFGLRQRKSLLVVVFVAACNHGVYSLGAGPIDDSPLASGGMTSKIINVGSSPGGGSVTTGGTSSAAISTGGSTTGGVALSSGGKASVADASCATGGLNATADILSVSSDGTVGNQSSDQPGLSADGRVVVFTSAADNLVPGDTNGVSDVFALNRDTGSIVRISVGPSGAQFDASSSMPALSPDTTRIAFVTAASNVATDASAGRMVIVSTAFNAGLSGFSSGLTAVTALDANADSSYPMLGNGGSLIVFRSQAANLVAGDTNGREDFFTVNPKSGVTSRIITASDDSGFVIDGCAPKLSADGSTLAFCGHLGSAPQNVSVVRLATGKSQLAGVTASGAASSGACYSPALTANGNSIAFVCDADDIVSGDTNGLADVFVRNLTSGVTTRLTDQGAESQVPGMNPAISGDGRRVVFQRGQQPNDPTSLYYGINTFDLECDSLIAFFVGTGIGTLGSTIPLSELSLNDNGDTLVATAGSISSTANSQIIALSYSQLP